MIPDDSELLRRFSREGSQESFAELVRRHLNLVYSIALRRLGGDAHRAADVAQGVFTDLARKADGLSRHPVLTGWLYTSTRHAADHAMRTERRRSAREQEAYMMQELNGNPVTEAEWIRLRPVLDDAMGGLDEADRTAVLLRFFEERPFAEIGRTLQLSEEAARKRVTRALARLEVLLAQRGITSTGTAVATLIAARATVAAPAALAAQVVQGAAAFAGAGTTMLGLSPAGLRVAAAVVILGLVGIVLKERNPSKSRDELPRVEPSAPVVVRQETPPPPSPAPVAAAVLPETPVVEPVVVEAPPPSPPPAPAYVPPPELNWTQTISVEFPRENARTLLTNLSKLYEFVLVMPDSFQGEISLKLDNAPLDQLLQNVLVPLGHTFVAEGRTIRVVPLPEESARAETQVPIASRE